MFKLSCFSVSYFHIKIFTRIFFMKFSIFYLIYKIKIFENNIKRGCLSGLRGASEDRNFVGSNPTPRIFFLFIK